MAFGMDYEKILRRHVLEEELRGGTDAVKDADLKLTAPPIKPQNRTNTTKLWWDAIMNDRSVAAAGLVRQRNVDVDARDGCGRTALWHYAWRGDDTGLRHLLDLGADASVVDGDGDGPLAAVARRGEARCIECVEVLLRRGAPTDTRNDDGRTALWHASNYGRTKVVDALLRGGADANAGDRNRATPVHAACAAGRVACARLLIQNGGDARRLDGDGRSCLHAACKSGDIEIVAAMLDAPVDIDGRDALGQTALWQACRDGFEDVCALLLKRGASPEIAAHSGRLPREIAELHGHAAVIATLDEPATPPARVFRARMLRCWDATSPFIINFRFGAHSRVPIGHSKLNMKGVVRHFGSKGRVSGIDLSRPRRGQGFVPRNRGSKPWSRRGL